MTDVSLWPSRGDGSAPYTQLQCSALSVLRLLPVREVRVPVRREVVMVQLGEVCRRGGLVLLPRDRALLEAR